MQAPDPWTYSSPRWGEGPQAFLNRLCAMEREARKRPCLGAKERETLAAWRVAWEKVMGYIREAREEEKCPEPCAPGKCRVWEKIIEGEEGKGAEVIWQPITAREIARRFLTEGCEGSQGRGRACLAHLRQVALTEEEWDVILLGTPRARAMEAKREKEAQERRKARARNARQRATEDTESGWRQPVQGVESPQGGVPPDRAGLTGELDL